MAFSLKNLLIDVASGLVKEALRQATGSKGQQGGRRERGGRATAPRSDYPGDFTGSPPISYEPREGDQGDPGEVVWAWVPFEEDHTQGKDRPVLLIGRDGGWLLGVPLTSKDHDRDAAQEARAGREWIDVGTGAWDRKGRPSEARVDRIVRVAPAAVRRTGAALDRTIFEQVTAAIRSSHRA